uniref:Putative ovule protein n=1 Tax=Solanum chacoense TaxID=4108 RepID=A0A0V0IU61_SOLCH
MENSSLISSQFQRGLLLPTTRRKRYTTLFPLFSLHGYCGFSFQSQLLLLTFFNLFTDIVGSFFLDLQNFLTGGAFLA